MSDSTRDLGADAPADDSTELVESPVAPEVTDSTEAPVAPDAPTKLTPAERRDAAAAGFRSAIDTGAPDVTELGNLFGAVPNGGAHLDAVSGAVLIELVTAGDMSGAEKVAQLTGAVRDALPVAAPVARSAKVVDPAIARRADLDALGARLATFGLLSAIQASLADQVWASPVTDLTDEERAHVESTCAPDAVARAIETLSGRVGRIGAATGATGERMSATDAGADQRWFQPGATFEHGAHTLVVVEGSLNEKGHVVGTFTVTNGATGATGTATSPSAAASLVNGGTAANGKKYWHAVTGD